MSYDKSHSCCSRWFQHKFLNDKRWWSGRNEKSNSKVSNPCKMSTNSWLRMMVKCLEYIWKTRKMIITLLHDHFMRITIHLPEHLPINGHLARLDETLAFHLVVQPKSHQISSCKIDPCFRLELTHMSYVKPPDDESSNYLRSNHIPLNEHHQYSQLCRLIVRHVLLQMIGLIVPFILMNSFI